MKKVYKSVFSIVMIAMLFVTANSKVFAAEEQVYDDVAKECNDIYLEENNDDSNEYFEFGNPNLRIDANGSFTFSYKREMSSSTFKPAATSITVYSKATSSTDNKTYYISLYKYNSSGDDTFLKKIKYTANGTSQSYKFTGLSTSSKYYLYFSKPLTSSATITGSGRIASIK